MPGANLTRIEAEERKSVIAAPVHYTVKLDLTRGAKNFGSETTITFDAEPGATSFLDLIATEVSEIVLNGETLDPAEAFADSRIELKNLEAHNEVTVKALCQYSNTGEGLHRSVDPSDGNIYLYSQFEVPDARRVYAVFDQPDIKAVFDFSVLAAKSWIVTSNMPAASVTDNETVTEEGTLGTHEAETTKLWVFESTPTMSSYLTAICAGPYAEWHTEYANEDGRTVPMAMYCRQALAEAFAKDVDYLFDITKKGRLLCEDLGRAVSVRQVRPDLRAGIQRRRYGEHRHGHHPRPVRVRIEGHRRVCRAPRGHRAARACTHVVRRLRDHEVVERPVAQRILRRVHVHSRHCRSHGMEGRLGHIQLRREELGTAPGPAEHHPPDRRADQRSERHVRQLRRHHLCQGRFRVEAARVLCGS
jgi:hypothetical protein